MKEEEIRKRAAFNRYLELIAEDVKTIFADSGSFVKIDCPAWSFTPRQRTGSSG